MTRRNYSQQDLCNEVYKAVQNSTEPLTRLEICKAIGRKKSPHILAMIEHLVTTGFISKSTIEDVQWGRAFVYSKIESQTGQACQDVA